MTYFFRKTEAINFYNANSDNSDLMLFCNDKENSSAKEFCVADPLYIYNCMMKTNPENNNYYEFWTSDDRLVFGLDVDIKTNKKLLINELENNETDQIAIKLIETVKQGFQQILKKNLDIEKIIVLESNYCGSKHSFHIVFRGYSFDNVILCKEFYDKLVDKYGQEQLRYADRAIYGNTCFRLCYSSKSGKNNILLPKQLTIGGKKTYMPNQAENPFEFWKKTMITYIEDDIEINSIGNQEKIKLDKIPKDKKNDKENKLSEEEISDLLDKFSEEYVDDYDKWMKIGYTLKTMDANYFEIWNKWSQKSEKYDEKTTIKKWNSFKITRSEKTAVGTLINMAKKAGICVSKKDLKSIIDSYPVRPVILSREKDPLYSIALNNVKIVNLKKLTTEIFTDEIMSKRFISIQSEKGTGKSSNFFKKLFSLKGIENKSILFVSSRRTFGAKLLSDIQKYKFSLYSEFQGPIFEKRIICQVDSLWKLKCSNFQYIIIDECETLAKYLTSPNFTKNNKASDVIDDLENRIKNAEHVVAMDADLSDRCMDYFITIMNKRKELKSKDMWLLINECKSYDDYTIEYCNYQTWLNKLFLDLDENKKIIIPTASNNEAKTLYNYMVTRYPNKRILIIHKETSEKEKMDLLYKVNETWINYDIIIYSPSVCMGVSFDVMHFDYIYVYGCTNSLGAHELCQMIHRTREPKQKTIYYTMKQWKSYSESDDNISPDRIEKILCNDFYLTHYDLHTNIVKKHKDRDDIGRVKIDYPYKSDPIFAVYKHNCLDKIRDCQNYGASVFGYLKYKGYTLKHLPFCENKTFNIDMLKQSKELNDEKEKKETIDGIMIARDITKQEYSKLLNESKSKQINKQEQDEINRYILKNTYQLENQQDYTPGFVELYHDKEKQKWYKNISNVMDCVAANGEKITTDQKLEYLKTLQMCKIQKGCHKDLSSTNYFAINYYPLELIKKLHYDINNLSIYHSYDVFIGYLEDTIKWLSSIKDIISYKYNKNLYGKNILSMTEKAKLALINSIIKSHYGMLVKNNKSIYYLTDNNIWFAIPRSVKIIAKNIINTHEDNYDDLLG